MSNREAKGDAGEPGRYKSLADLQANPPKYTLPNGVEVDMATIDAMSPADFDEWYENVAFANPEDIES